MSVPTPTSSRTARRRPVSKELKLFEAMENFTRENDDPSASFIEKFVNFDLDLNSTHQSSVVEEDDSVAGSVPSQSPMKPDRGQLKANNILLPTVKGKTVSFCEEPDKISFIADSSDGDLSDDDADDNDNHNDDFRCRNDDDSVIVFSSCEDDDDDDDDDDSDDENPGRCLTIRGIERNESLNDVPLTHEKDLSDLIEDAVMKKHGTEYLLLTEIKRSLELKESQLERERENFTELQKAEQKKLKGEIQRVENQRKSLQRLIADYHKLKSSRDENESKMKELMDKLRETKLEMNKRITRWGEQQRKLEERVKNLEIENQELKKQKAISQRPGVLKRPPLGLRAARNSKENSQKFEEDGSKTSKGSTKCTPPSKSPTSYAGSFENNANDSGISAGISDTTGEESERKRHADSENPRVVNLSDDGADQTMSSDYIEIRHSCGTISRFAKDNKVIRHVMVNGDILDEHEDGSVCYYYKSLQFSQTTYPNGDEIIEYDSGAVETIRADGSKILTFPCGLVKYIDRLGQEEVCFNDGSIMKKSANGECSITWPNGQKEVRTPSYLKRIYPNGTVKIMYNDGSEETRYWNGRIRRKDKNGVLVDDTKPKKKSKTLKSNVGVMHSTI